MRGETGVLRERGEVIDVDMARKPTTDEIFEQLVASSRVPLEEVKRHPHGAIFADPPITVAPGDPANAARLDVGNADMLRELAAVAREGARAAEVKGRPFRLVSRRMPNAYNSSGRDIAALTRGRPYNPAFLHPDDLAALGLAEGDAVRIARTTRASSASPRPRPSCAAACSRCRTRSATRRTATASTARSAARRAGSSTASASSTALGHPAHERDPGLDRTRGGGVTRGASRAASRS